MEKEFATLSVKFDNQYCSGDIRTIEDGVIFNGGLAADADNFKSIAASVSEKLEAWAATAIVGEKIFWLGCRIARVA